MTRRGPCSGRLAKVRMAYGRHALLLRFADARRAEWQIMNEVALHRGRSPHLTTVDAYVDGQHLTESVVSCPAPSTRAFELTAATLWRPLVRRAHHLHPDGLHGILAERGRADRASLPLRAGPDAHLPTKPLFSPSHIPFVFFNHTAGTSGLLVCGAEADGCCRLATAAARPPACPWTEWSRASSSRGNP